MSAGADAEARIQRGVKVENYEGVRIPWPGWKVIEELGEGGYGKVYEIERTQHGITERDALKIIRIPTNRRQYDELAYRMTSEDPESINAVFSDQKDKVIEEIRAMQKLKANDNIVGIKDWTVEKLDDGYSWEIFIRMDVLTPMIQFIKGRVMDDSEVIRLGKDICNALVQCEKENIVHRDIKPDNIMVSSVGKFMLTDFGIARYLDDETTMTGIGSKPYMAPEVANYQKSDHTVDIYSLGLVMYEALNNYRPPFVNTDGKYSAIEKEAAIQRRIKGEALPEPLGGSELLKKIVLKACSPKPSKRYKSAEVMLKDLDILQKRMSAGLVRPVSSNEKEVPEDSDKTEAFTVNVPENEINVLRRIHAAANINRKSENNPAAETGKNEGPKSTAGAIAASHNKQSDKKVNLKAWFKGRKKLAIIGSIVAAILILVLTVNVFIPRHKQEKLYDDFKKVATENGWEVGDILYTSLYDMVYYHFDNYYGFTSVKKYVNDEDLVSVLVSFYSDEEEYERKAKYINSENSYSDKTIVNSNLTLTKTTDGSTEIEAYKGMTTYDAYVDTEEEKAAVFELLETMGIRTEADGNSETPDDTGTAPEIIDKTQEPYYEDEEGIIYNLSGQFAEEQETFDNWQVGKFVLNEAVSNPEWIEVRTELSKVEKDVKGTYELMSKSGEKWTSLGTFTIEQADTFYEEVFKVPEGQSVEAIALVPKEASPGEHTTGLSVLKAKKRYITGATYTLKDNLNVRSEPKVADNNIKKKTDLTEEYKNSTVEKTDKAILKEGSKVKCLELKGNWMRIEDSSWICVWDKEALVVP